MADPTTSPTVNGQGKITTPQQALTDPAFHAITNTEIKRGILSQLSPDKFATASREDQDATLALPMEHWVTKFTGEANALAQTKATDKTVGSINALGKSPDLPSPAINASPVVSSGMGARPYSFNNLPSQLPLPPEQGTPQGAQPPMASLPTPPSNPPASSLVTPAFKPLSLMHDIDPVTGLTSGLRKPTWEELNQNRLSQIPRTSEALTSRSADLESKKSDIINQSAQLKKKHQQLQKQAMGPFNSQDEIDAYKAKVDAFNQTVAQSNLDAEAYSGQVGQLNQLSSMKKEDDIINAIQDKIQKKNASTETSMSALPTGSIPPPMPPLKFEGNTGDEYINQFMGMGARAVAGTALTIANAPANIINTGAGWVNKATGLNIPPIPTIDNPVNAPKASGLPYESVARIAGSVFGSALLAKPAMDAFAGTLGTITSTLPTGVANIVNTTAQLGFTADIAAHGGAAARDFFKAYNKGDQQGMEQAVASFVMDTTYAAMMVHGLNKQADAFSDLWNKRVSQQQEYRFNKATNVTPGEPKPQGALGAGNNEVPPQQGVSSQRLLPPLAGIAPEQRALPPGPGQVKVPGGGTIPSMSAPIIPGQEGGIGPFKNIERIPGTQGQAVTPASQNPPPNTPVKPGIPLNESDLIFIRDRIKLIEDGKLQNPGIDIEEVKNQLALASDRNKFSNLRTFRNERGISDPTDDILKTVEAKLAAPVPGSKGVLQGLQRQNISQSGSLSAPGEEPLQIPENAEPVTPNGETPTSEVNLLKQLGSESSGLPAPPPGGMKGPGSVSTSVTPMKELIAPQGFPEQLAATHAYLRSLGWSPENPEIKPLSNLIGSPVIARPYQGSYEGKTESSIQLDFPDANTTREDVEVAASALAGQSHQAEVAIVSHDPGSAAYAGLSFSKPDKTPFTQEEIDSVGKSDNGHTVSPDQKSIIFSNWGNSDVESFFNDTMKAIQPTGLTYANGAPFRGGSYLVGNKDFEGIVQRSRDARATSGRPDISDQVLGTLKNAFKRAHPVAATLADIQSPLSGSKFAGSGRTQAVGSVAGDNGVGSSGATKSGNGAGGGLVSPEGGGGLESPVQGGGIIPTEPVGSSPNVATSSSVVEALGQLPTTWKSLEPGQTVKGVAYGKKLASSPWKTIDNTPLTVFDSGNLYGDKYAESLINHPAMKRVMSVDNRMYSDISNYLSATYPGMGFDNSPNIGETVDPTLLAVHINSVPLLGNGAPFPVMSNTLMQIDQNFALMKTGEIGPEDLASFYVQLKVACLFHEAMHQTHMKDDPGFNHILAVVTLVNKDFIQDTINKYTDELSVNNSQAIRDLIPLHSEYVAKSENVLRSMNKSWSGTVAPDEVRGMDLSSLPDSDIEQAALVPPPGSNALLMYRGIEPPPGDPTGSKTLNESESLDQEKDAAITKGWDTKAKYIKNIAEMISDGRVTSIGRAKEELISAGASEGITGKRLDELYKAATRKAANKFKGLTEDEKSTLRPVDIAAVNEFSKDIVPKIVEIEALSELGKRTKGWYLRADGALTWMSNYLPSPPEMTPKESRATFVKLMAALSPQQGVRDNLLQALKTWRLWADPQSAKAEYPDLELHPDIVPFDRDPYHLKTLITKSIPDWDISPSGDKKYKYERTPEGKRIYDVNSDTGEKTPRVVYVRKGTVDLNARINNSITAFSGKGKFDITERRPDPKTGKNKSVKIGEEWRDVDPHELSGFKVTSFAKNILGFIEPYTADTHQANAFGVNPKILGTKAGYLAVTNAGRIGASNVNMDPREGQETSWNPIRALFLMNRLQKIPFQEGVKLLTPELLAEYSAGAEVSSLLVKDPDVTRELDKLGISDSVRKAQDYLQAITEYGRDLSEPKAISPKILKRIADSAERVADRRAKERAAKYDEEPSIDESDASDNDNIEQAARTPGIEDEEGGLTPPPESPRYKRESKSTSIVRREGEIGKRGTIALPLPPVDTRLADAIIRKTLSPDMESGGIVRRIINKILPQTPGRPMREALRGILTGDRDFLETNVYQQTSLAREICPDVNQQEALTVMREFRSRPVETFTELLNGTHPYYREYQDYLLNEKHLSPREAISKVEEAQARVKDRLTPLFQLAANPTPEMQSGDRILTGALGQMRDKGTESGALHSDITEDEYVTHIIIGEPPPERMSGMATNDRVGAAPLASPFAKKRTFGDLVKADIFGKKIATWNAFDATDMYGKSMSKTIATRNFISILQRNESLKWGDVKGSNIPEILDADGKRVWIPYARGMDPLWKNTVNLKDESGARVPSESVAYGPRKIVEALYPITDPDATSTSALVQNTRAYQAWLKSVEVSLSGYHAYSLSLAAAANMGPVEMVKAAKTNMSDPETMAEELKWVKRGMTTPIQGTAIETRRRVQHGLQVDDPGFMDRVAGLPVAKQALALSDATRHFIFDVMQRQFKLTDAEAQEAAFISKNPDINPVDLELAMRRVARQVNSVYGGLHWENLGVSKTNKALIGMATFAPDWTFSNYFSFASIFEKGPAGMAARRFWLMSMLIGAGLTELTNVLFTGKLYSNPLRAHLGKDKEGKEITSNLFFAGGPNDIVNAANNITEYGAHGLIKSLTSKATPVAREILQEASDTKWNGQKISIKGDPLASTIRSGINAGTNLLPLPFGISNMFNMNMDPIPYSIAEYLAEALIARTFKHGPPEGEQAIKTGYLKGETKPVTEQEQSSLFQRVFNRNTHAPTPMGFNRMDLDKAISAYEKMDSDQRDRFKGMLLRKVPKIGRYVNPIVRADLQERLENLGILRKTGEKIPQETEGLPIPPDYRDFEGLPTPVPPQ